MFILCSILPLFLLSFVFTEISQWTVRRNTQHQAEDVIREAAAIAQETINTAANLGRQLSTSALVTQWCSGGGTKEETNTLISELFQAVARSVNESDYQIYFVSPAQGGTTISRNIVPPEYTLAQYADWGIFHRVKEIPDGTLFVQPHPKTGNCIAAVCVPVSGSGYVIVDILRSGLAAKLSQVADMNMFASLYIYDSSGCIAYSGFSREAEAAFLQDLMRTSDTNPSDQTLPARTVSTAFSSARLHICGILPKGENTRYILGLQKMTLKTAFLTALFAVIISIIISRSVAQPVKSLADAMQKAESGELDVQCNEPANAFADQDMIFLIRRFNKMVYRIGELTDDRVEQQRLLRVAEVKNLQAQISPHFLYNTLNSIKSMAKFAGAANVARMVTKLGKLLHETFASEGDFCSIEHALEAVRNYFDIEAMRWENRFLLIEDVDQELLPYPIPRLVIQPVVENALVHGLEEKTTNGTLNIRGYFQEHSDSDAPQTPGTDGSSTVTHKRDIIIEVSDDGAGMDAVTLKEIQENLRTVTRTKRLGSSGIALVNTHSRLRLLYGEAYGLSIQSQEGSGTTVTIRIPEDTKHDTSVGS